MVALAILFGFVLSKLVGERISSSDDDVKVDLSKISSGLGSESCSSSCSDGKTFHWCPEKKQLVYGHGDQRCKCGSRSQTRFGLMEEEPYSILDNYPLIKLPKEEKKYSYLNNLPSINLPEEEEPPSIWDKYPALKTFLKTREKKKNKYLFDY